MNTTRLWVAVTVAALSAATVACSSGRVGADEARLEADGTVFVAHSGERYTRVDGGRTLRRGDQVKVEAGAARVVTANGSTLELRRGSQLRMAGIPELVAGHLLVTSATAADVTMGATRFRTRGASHLVRRLAMSAASYSGSATIRSAGRVMEVPALREATVPALGLLPAKPSPLQYDGDDPWDRRFLSPAIEFGEQLEARSRGLEAQVPAGEGRTPGFYRTLLPTLEREVALDVLFDPNRPTGETLVGAAIASMGEAPGNFATRWTSTFSFRDDGAHWGLVALDQRAMSARLSSTLDAALGRAPTVFAATAPTVRGPAVPPAAVGGVAGPAAPPSGPTPPPPTDPPPPVVDLPDPLPDDPLPTGGVLDPVVDTVVDVVGGLLGAIVGGRR